MAVSADERSPVGRREPPESYSILQQPEIHIHASPAQTPQDIAEMVIRALRKERRREESRRRSTYYDRS